MNLDNTIITGSCPNCKHKFTFTVSEYKASDHMVCPACGVHSPTKGSEFAEALERIQRSADSVGEVVREMNKRNKLP